MKNKILKNAVRSVVVSLFLYNCSTEIESKEKQNFFRFDVFFNKQINFLTNQKTTVNKNIITAKTNETKLLKNIDWTKELADFNDLDINKPALANLYLIEKTDSTENYALKPNEKATIKKIEIKKAKDGSVASISINQDYKNPLYNWQKKLIFIVKNKQAKSYEVSYKQSLFGIGNENFIVKGEIVTLQ